MMMHQTHLHQPWRLDRCNIHFTTGWIDVTINSRHFTTCFHQWFRSVERCYMSEAALLYHDRQYSLLMSGHLRSDIASTVSGLMAQMESNRQSIRAETGVSEQSSQQATQRSGNTGEVLATHHRQLAQDSMR